MTIIGFYHPFCNGGGGGERVLWKLIDTLAKRSQTIIDQRSIASDDGELYSDELYSDESDVEELDDEGNVLVQSPKSKNNNNSNISASSTTTTPPTSIIIYTCESATPEEIFANVFKKFQILIPKPTILPIQFVYIKNGKELLDANSYKRFTMIGQSVGSMIFAYRGLTSFLNPTLPDTSNANTPDIFFDTTGAAFTYPVSYFLNRKCKIYTYTHYPTISTDMLKLVYSRRPNFNNEVSDQKSSASIILFTFCKLIYYLGFTLCYALAGSCASLVMVNSSWTCNHIQKIWRLAPNPNVVFPPCDVKGFSILDVNKKRKNYVLSIGQFRPEKDHDLQLRAFALLVNKDGGIMLKKNKDLRLVLIGGCRDEGDEGRVAKLRETAVELNIGELVKFEINQPYSVLKEYLAVSSIGIHTMWNEHFGIGIVEMMAAGLVVVANNSGGPKEDIVRPLLVDGVNSRITNPLLLEKREGGGSNTSSSLTGFLAKSPEEYADKMEQILNYSLKDIRLIRENGRKQSFVFSDEEFDFRINELLEGRL